MEVFGHQDAEILSFAFKPDVAVLKLGVEIRIQGFRTMT